MIPAAVYYVMISSPGDVKEERQIARQIANEWTIDNVEDDNVVLLPLLWEHDSTPAVGQAQEIINTQLLERAQMVVVIFWGRIGTATGQSISGTVEELERAKNDGKDVLVYFSKAALPSDVDADQLRSLREYKNAISKVVKYEEFDNTDDFRAKFTRHLRQTLRNGHYPGLSIEELISMRLPSDPIESLSDDAKQLLLAVGDDGEMLKYEMPDTTFIQVDNRSFGGTDRRTAARYVKALEDLKNIGLVSWEEGVIYRVTHYGYGVIDKLREPTTPSCEG